MCLLTFLKRLRTVADDPNYQLSQEEEGLQSYVSAGNPANSNKRVKTFHAGEAAEAQRKNVTLIINLTTSS